MLAGVLYWWVVRSRRALHDSEKRFRTLFEQNSCVMLFMDAQTGHILDANEEAVRYLGYTRAELVGMPIDHINTHSPERLMAARTSALQRKRNYFEFTYRLASGEMREVEVYATPLEFDVPPTLLAIVHDITERKQTQDMLNKFSIAVEQSPASVVITDLTGAIQYVNPRFTQITGYSAAEALGKNPRILRSLETAHATYVDMWSRITSGKLWHGELHNKRKNGELYWEEINVAPVMNPAGIMTHYVAIKTDITERKELQEKVHQLAFHDALTQLPNRHLLNDRLRQSMAASKRSGLYGALMFLDLDNFKPLNDLHGHDVGDLLLIEVADRLKRCVREIDTVARFGGDEFVLILNELAAGEAESTQQAGQIAEKIRLTLAEPYLLTLAAQGRATGTVQHHCTASIGVALFVDHEDRLADIFKWADTAMYQAKAAGRNQVRFHAADAGVLTSPL
jgi:diguanylate cyclase (GGDEF)-like protein/PAS domain S-box-containing protein